MGFSGMSFGSILLIALVVVLLFGGNRIAQLGEDMGKAIKGFKKAIDDDQSKES